MHVQAYIWVFFTCFILTRTVTVMKNTATPEPKTVSKRVEKVHVQPVRVSDMGMGIRASKEIEKKHPAEATV
jgi:hypothetical protein